MEQRTPTELRVRSNHASAETGGSKSASKDEMGRESMDQDQRTEGAVHTGVEGSPVGLDGGCAEGVRRWGRRVGTTCESRLLPPS